MKKLTNDKNKSSENCGATIAKIRWANNGSMQKTQDTLIEMSRKILGGALFGEKCEKHATTHASQNSVGEGKSVIEKYPSIYNRDIERQVLKIISLT